MTSNTHELGIALQELAAAMQRDIDELGRIRVDLLSQERQSKAENDRLAQELAILRSFMVSRSPVDDFGQEIEVAP